MSFNEKMTAIADRIRSYTSKTDKLSLDGMASGVDEVNLSGFRVGLTEGDKQGYQRGLDEGYATGVQKGFQEGVASVPDYLQYAKQVQFTDLNMFENVPVDKATGYKTLTFNVPNMTSFSSFFNRTVENKNVEHIIINGSNDGTITTMANAFGNLNSKDETIKRITLNCNLSKCSNYANTFCGCNALEKIEGELDCSKTTSQAGVSSILKGCVALRSVRFAPNTIGYKITIADSPNFSSDTVESIIGGLKSVTQARILTINDYVKITEALITEATNKGWTITGGALVSQEEFDANRE